MFAVIYISKIYCLQSVHYKLTKGLVTNKKRQAKS